MFVVTQGDTSKLSKKKNGRKNKKGKQKERNQAARRSRLTFENQLRLILKAFNIKTDLFEDNS